MLCLVNYPLILWQIRPLILEAGELLLSYYNKPSAMKKIEKKGHLDLVTAADKDCEALLTSRLGEAFPEHGALAEEGTSTKGSSGYTWVLDPLDGTTSFAHGFPQFSISLALVDKDSQPVIGVVYAPVLGNYFEAFAGGGARCNGRTISASGHGEIEGSLLGTGFPYDRRERMEIILERTKRILNRAHDLRRTGTAALDLCYVAAGELDGYYEDGLKAWDVAAALLIAREAGAQIRTFKDEEATIYSGDFLAGSDGLVRQLSQQLASTV